VEIGTSIKDFTGASSALGLQKEFQYLATLKQLLPQRLSAFVLLP
jgi:hypothetical protein